MLFDFDKIESANRYKLIVSTVTPRPIAWVVTQDAGGLVNAAPYSFFNAFANDPPVLIIGIGGRKPGDAKDTGNNIRETGEFVINLVSAANAEQMNITAIDFPHDVNEIAEAGLTTVPSTKVKPPRIAESPVAFECERLMNIDLSNERTLVLGKVLAVHVRDDCVLNAERCHIDNEKLDLVGRLHGAGWYTRTRDRFDMPRIAVKDWTRRT
jgi:flavin reductase (DIM6/NTAB) family NADH-FMN oxidoreductase RutF